MLADWTTGIVVAVPVFSLARQRHGYRLPFDGGVAAHARAACAAATRPRRALGRGATRTGRRRSGTAITVFAFAPTARADGAADRVKIANAAAGGLKHPVGRVPRGRTRIYDGASDASLEAAGSSATHTS